MKNTLSRVSFIVHENHKFQVADHLLCTISGGQDSILNLILLYHLEVFYFFQINLVYCNHFWQPTNFYTLFELLKFGYLLNKPITNCVPKQILLSEEEAHFWRQKNFYQIGSYLKLNSVILGHSLSDQIETSFWYFIRGCGPNGLTSLKQNSFIGTKKFKTILAKTYPKPQRYETNCQIKFFARNKDEKKYFLKIKLKNYPFHRGSSKLIRIFPSTTYLKLGKNRAINNFKLKRSAQQYLYLFCSSKKSQIKIRRPLLGFSRTIIGQLINQNYLPRIIDTTNQSKKLIRNKIRLILFPLLNLSFQIKFHGNISKYLTIIQEEQIYFSILEKNLFKIYLKNPKELNDLQIAPIAIKRYIVKTLLKHYMSNQVMMNYIMHILKF